MTSSDDGGYVHDPARFEEDGTARSGSSVNQESSDGDDWLDDPAHPEEADREFGRRGWLLVGVIVFAFILCPLAILLYPPDASGYRFALIILPLAPALVLAATAVWATTRP